MTPAKLDVQLRLELMLPSSLSVAVPVKDTEVVSTKDEPPAGESILTIGAIDQVTVNGENALGSDRFDQACFGHVVEGIPRNCGADAIVTVALDVTNDGPLTAQLPQRLEHLLVMRLL